MASSSSGSRKYDVFPSFSGEDVRKSFLSHLLKELNRKSIIPFIDHDIVRSCPIRTELVSAIRESRSAIVIFSKKYASSTWCLNELAEIHERYKLSQILVIPIFYEIDPSHVRKQTEEFGKFFEATCEGKTEYDKQRWMLALEDVANIAGEDSRNWKDEAKLVEQISNDVSNKLFTPSDDFADLVGIDAHVEAMNSMLCLESEEVRMVGIVGTSGIGKTSLARALFNRISSQFHHHAFVSYKRTIEDDYSMKLAWAKQFLSEILCQKDIKIESLGAVEQRLKHQKVLIVVDDVDEREVLEALVGNTGWFGFGSRIIVVTQDRAILKQHEIDLVYEVQLPSTELALEMFCRSAFRRNSPPDGFMKLAVEVAKLSCKLPLGLKIMGLSLRGRDKEQWLEMMPRLRDSLDGKIMKTLRVGYDGLDGKDQLIFLYIACLLNYHTVNYIRNVLGDSVNIGLRVLIEKSLISISSPDKTVEMHNLLQMLGRDIVRAESVYNPGKRRFLLDVEDICDVFHNNTGTETVLGISFNTSEIKSPLFLDEKSFQGMHNLQFLKVYKEWSRESGEGRLYVPQGLVYLPRKLRILYWDECPLKCMPSSFRAEYLVKLSMKNSKLDKLWEGTQPLSSLKKINIAGSRDLKEIPDLSYAINLEKMNLSRCTSLVTLPSSIRHLGKLKVLQMISCSKVEVLPTDVNLESLDHLNLNGCSRLRNFPKISKNISVLSLNGNCIEEEDSLWIENISRFTCLVLDFCPLRCLPSNFRPECLVYLYIIRSKLEKLWEGVQSLGNLLEMYLSGSENLKEFPNLSKATKLKKLYLDGCKSLVKVPCSIRNLNKLEELSMGRCTKLECLPSNLNLRSLKILYLSGCSQLRIFPQISRNINELSLNRTAIEEVPSWIKHFSKLTTLKMIGCNKLKNISPSIFELELLEFVDFSDSGVTEFEDAGVMAKISRTIDDRLALSEKSSFLVVKILLLCGMFMKLLILCAKIVKSLSFDISHAFNNPGSRLSFDNCFKLDRNARKLIIQSDFKYTILPGGIVPKYFTHRARGRFLTIPFLESSISEDYFGFKACVALKPRTVTEFDYPCVGVVLFCRGKMGLYRFNFQMVSTKKEHLTTDHLLVYHFKFPTENVVESPYELDYDKIKFEFYYHIYGCPHYLDDCTYHTGACPYSVQSIKGCGIRLWHVTPSKSSSLIAETDQTFELRGDFSDSSSSSDEGEDLDKDESGDYSSLSSLEEEEEDSDNHLSDDELNNSSFFCR